MKFEKIYNNLNEYYLNDLKQCISDLKTKGKRKKQIPNILTASRIISPLFIIPCTLSGNLIAAAILTSTFAITDCFDGMIARKLNATSKFGKELDPIADKFFAAGILIPLIKYNSIMLVNTLLELTIASINSISKIKGNNPKTSSIGKIKTWALSILVITNYCSLFIPLNELILSSVFAVTTVLQAGSAITYLVEDIKKDNNKRITTSEKSKISNIQKQKKSSSNKKIISLLKTTRNSIKNENKEIANYEKTLRK